MATLVTTIACLALFGIVYGFAFPSAALAWDNCPKGLTNDPYPGACRRYEDTNDDGICDLSQPKPTESTTTTTTAPKSTATTTSLAVTTTTSGEPPTGDCPLGPCAGCGACFSIGSLAADPSAEVADTFVAADTTAEGSADEGATGAVVLATAAGSADTTTTTTPSGGSGAATDGALASSTGGAEDLGSSSFFTGYNVSPIAIVFFVVYAVSFFLYKTKRMRIATHRKIWNVLLMATFLITGIFGLILTIQLDYQLPFTIPFDLLFWHVEAGVVMTLISLFHMGWHFNYYRSLLRRGRSKVRAARASERAAAVDDRQLVWEAREQRRAGREARRTDAAVERTAARRREVAPRPWPKPETD